MFAEHCSECWAHASIQNQEDIHRIIIRTQKKSITSYPGGSRKASLKKEPLEGVLKDEKMVEEGIPSREWETVHQAEARVTKDAPGPVPLHAWNGRQRAKSSLGKQDKVTGTLMSQQDFPVVDVQSLSSAQLFAAPWTAAHQASLSITSSGNLLKLMSIESVMPSNLYRLLLLLPSIFPSIRVFSNESGLCIRWLQLLNCGVEDSWELPVNPKGNQSWIFIGRTDADAEAEAHS